MIVALYISKQFFVIFNFACTHEWHTHARPVLLNHCQSVVSSLEYMGQNQGSDYAAHEHKPMVLVPYIDADLTMWCYSQSQLMFFFGLIFVCIEEVEQFLCVFFISINRSFCACRSM